MTRKCYYNYNDVPENNEMTTEKKKNILSTCSSFY